MSDNDSKNFKQAYERLGEIAKELESASESDLDNVLSKVEEAQLLYGQVKERIEQVNQGLAKLTNVDTTKPAPPNGGFDDSDLDDDIPFNQGRAKLTNADTKKPAPTDSGFDDGDMDDDIPF